MKDGYPIFRLLTGAPGNGWRTTSLAFLLGLATSSDAQIQQAWVAKYNNGITNGYHQALKIALDSVGNIYVTGFSENSNGKDDYATLKYAANGTLLWAALFESTNVTAAQPAALAVDAQGNVVVTGNAITVKYDANGNQLWTAPYAGSAVGVDSNGNIFVTGYSNGFNTVKLAPSGTNLWSQTYVSQWGPCLSECLTVDSAGNVYITGSDQAYACYTEGPYQYCYLWLLTVKYNSDGVPLWSAVYTSHPGGTLGPLSVKGTALDSSGALYVLADGPPDDVMATPYGLSRIVPNGSVAWSLGNPTDGGNSVSYGLAVDSYGNAWVTGQNNAYSKPVYGTYGISVSGTFTWTNNYPQNPVGVSAGTAISTDQLGNTYVTGYSPSPGTTEDIVTIKYDQNGNQIWLGRYDGPPSSPLKKSYN